MSTASGAIRVSVEQVMISLQSCRSPTTTPPRGTHQKRRISRHHIVPGVWFGGIVPHLVRIGPEWQRNARP